MADNTLTLTEAKGDLDYYTTLLVARIRNREVIESQVKRSAIPSTRDAWNEALDAAKRDEAEARKGLMEASKRYTDVLYGALSGE